MPFLSKFNTHLCSSIYFQNTVSDEMFLIFKLNN
jgi:hypothetical protein